MVKIEGSWRDVKNACRTTVGKRHTEKDATERFKRDLVIAEHTPIRKLHVSWLWEDMPYKAIGRLKKKLIYKRRK